MTFEVHVKLSINITSTKSELISNKNFLNLCLQKSSSTTLLNVHAMTGVELIPGKTIRFSVQRRPIWTEKILLTHSKAAS